MIQELVDTFKLNAHVRWNDSVTHLIVKILPNGKCVRTRKIMNALLLNCFIVSFEWAKDCITSKTLLPEVYNFYTILVFLTIFFKNIFYFIQGRLYTTRLFWRTIPISVLACGTGNN